MKANLTGPYYVLSEQEIRRIHEASLGILRETGVHVPSERVLQALEAFGAQVDRAAQIVRFSPKLVEQCLERRRGEHEVQAQVESLRGQRVQVTWAGHSVNIVDHETDRVRPVTRSDYIQSNHLANVLDRVTLDGHLLQARDVPERMEDIWQWALMCKHSTKPSAGYPVYAHSIPYLWEMTVVLDGSEEEARKCRHWESFNAYCSSPLRYPEDALEKLLVVHDMGLPVSFGAPMVVTGGTGPMTLAGTVALGNAEALGGLVMGYAFNNTSWYGCAPVTMDQHTGVPLFADPRKLVACAAGMDMTRSYGFPQSSFHIGIDSHVPGGIQAGVERMFTSMLSLFLFHSGAQVRLGIMGPSNACASLAQVFIDLEMTEMIDAFLQGIVVNTETIAEDLIKSVGIGGTFLDQDHSAEKFRSEMWLPGVFKRANPEGRVGVDQDKALVHAKDKLRAALSQPVARPLTDGQEKEIDRILASATKAIVG